MLFFRNDATAMRVVDGRRNELNNVAIPASFNTHVCMVAHVVVPLVSVRTRLSATLSVQKNSLQLFVAA